MSAVIKKGEQKKGRQSHLQVGSIASIMLGELSRAIGVANLMMTRQGQRQLQYFNYDLEEMREEIEWQKKRDALRRLQKQELLKCRQVEKKFEIALTKKGAQEALRLKVMNAYVLENGTNCIVVFDIPERLRKVRIELGNFLDSAGFIRIQRSVWISPYKAATLLVDLFDAAGLNREWVRVYYAKEQL